MKKTFVLCLMLSSLALADFPIGTMVEYNQGATWIPAKVTGRVPNGYQVLLFPPGGTSYEVISTEANVRPGAGGPAPQQTTTAPNPGLPAAGAGQAVEYNQGATWAPAEVLEQISGGYRLRVHPPNGLPYEVVSTNANVRTANGAAPRPTANQPQPQPPQTAQTQNANVARMDNTNTNVETPNARLIEAVMRSMWERPADPGMDGAVTLSFENISIGAASPWTVLDGNQGTEGTTVWRAKVKWTHTTHYRTRNRVLLRNWTVSVFKNYLGKWVVQSTASTPQDETVREDPPDMK